MKKNYGFTLAEVLITLTIIGVIAAITIPTLMKKYQNHSNYTALKKTYSILSNAYKLVERDYGRYTDWPYKKDTNMPAIFAERMEEHLKIQKKCAGNGCFNYKVYGLNPKQETSLIGYGANSANSTSYILTDGTVLYFSPDGATNSSLQGLDRNDDNSSTAIFVDVNGKKGPNQFGRDIFVFGIAKEGWWNSTYGIKNSWDKIIPAGYTDIVKNHSTTVCNPQISSGWPYTGSAIGCAARALIQDNGIKY